MPHPLLDLSQKPVSLDAYSTSPTLNTCSRRCVSRLRKLLQPRHQLPRVLHRHSIVVTRSDPTDTAVAFQPQQPLRLCSLQECFLPGFVGVSVGAHDTETDV